MASEVYFFANPIMFGYWSKTITIAISIRVPKAAGVGNAVYPDI